jgi:mono/diheme cytochrome c family protein
VTLATTALLQQKRMGLRGWMGRMDEMLQLRFSVFPFSNLSREGRIVSPVTSALPPSPLIFASFWMAVWLCAVTTSVSADLPAVSFKRDVAPLLQRRCVACHGEESSKGGYRLDSFARMGKAGESDLAPIVAHKSGESELYRLLVEPDANDRMPQKAEALPKEEIALVERWIKEGAVNDSGPANRPLAELVRETLLLPAPAKYARAIPVTGLAFSPDGAQLAVSGYFEVTIWDVDTGALVRRIGGLPERITSIAWHPKTKLLAVTGGTPAQWGTVALIDPASGYQPRLLCDLPEMAFSVAFSPDGSRLAAGGGDRTIRFFDTGSGKQLRVVRPHADWVQSVAFSPDGAHLLSASRDRTVRLAEVSTGQIETTYAGHETAALTAIFSHDGKTALSLAQNSPVHVWETSSGNTKQKSFEVPGRPERLAWVSGGLAIGSADGLVRILQTTDQQTLFTLYGHGDAVTSIAVSRAPEVFATGSYDGTVCVWNVGCGTWVRRFVASPL